MPLAEGRLASNGGEGGKGFPGETKIVEIADLSVGERFDIQIGTGGSGGASGKGYETGAEGVAGANGFVIIVPLFAGDKGDR